MPSGTLASAAAHPPEADPVEDGDALVVVLDLGNVAEEFLVRPGEVAAWVAVDGVAVVGHVSVTELTGGRMAEEWHRATGRPADGLGEVSVLFVAGGRGGSEMGR